MPDIRKLETASADDLLNELRARSSKAPELATKRKAVSCGNWAGHPGASSLVVRFS